MKILYFIFLIMSAVFYPLFQDNLSFILLLMLLIFPILMLIIVTVTSKCVRLKISGFSNSVERGSKINLRLNVKNPLVIPIASFAVTMLYRSEGESAYRKYTVTIPVKAHSSETVIINIKADHCGCVECKIKKAVVYDFIGLFSRRIKLDYSCRIAVLPIEKGCKLYVTNSLECDNDSNTFSVHKSGSNPSEVYGLRNYTDGDRMNRIHWKLSSRSDDLVVKELSEPVSGNILIIPDIKACKDQTQSDNVLDVYASLARFLVSEGTGCKILVQNNESLYADVSNDDELDSIIINQVSSLCLYNDGLTMTEEFSAGCISMSIDSSTRFSHIIIITPSERKTALTELEQSGCSERISVLCIGKEGDVEEDKSSDVIIYNIFMNGSIDIPENFSI